MTTLGPYELNQIYCGECSAMMAELPDECIDLTVTSPPYDAMDEQLNLIPGGLRQYNGYHLNFGGLARQLWRVTKPGGVVVWVVGDATIDGSETCTSDIQKLYFRGLGFNVHDTMIYNRQGRYPDELRYYADFEFMFVFSKGSPKSIHLITDKVNIYAGTKIRGGDRQRNGEIKISWANKNGIRRKELGVRSNIWKFTANSQTSIDGHPAPFPEALARDHIISWSNPGDVVLDPMLGSGTTAKMAKELGRRWLGFDISAEYVELARRRVDGARVPLFVEQPSAPAQPEQAALW